METKDKGELQFYYIRERRLEKAGPNARFAVSLHDGKKPGFFRSFMATRSLRFIFFMLLFAMTASLVVSWLTSPKPSASLNGAVYSLEALWFEEDLYVSVTREGRNLSADAEVRVGAGDSAAAGRIEPGADGFRIKLALADKPEMAVAVVSSGGRSVELSAPVR
ncbi:MAG: hypothetical protein JW923_03370 [Spirochaetales bacterium]|nr:hypothetical protein [Spirochaetales bacterium]